MSKSVNKVTLLGHVGKEPEIRTTPGGMNVASFSIATNDRFKDKDGNWQDRTEWHNVVAFQRTAEIVRDYVKKGNQLYIEGKLQTRSWDDKESGQKKYRTEILVNELVLIGGRSGGDEGSGSGYTRKSSGGSSSSSGSSSNYDQRAPDDLPTAPITDDDVPF